MPQLISPLSQANAAKPLHADHGVHTRSLSVGPTEHPRGQRSPLVGRRGPVPISSPDTMPSARARAVGFPRTFSPPQAPDAAEALCSPVSHQTEKTEAQGSNRPDCLVSVWPAARFQASPADGRASTFNQCLRPLLTTR